MAGMRNMLLTTRRLVPGEKRIKDLSRLVHARESFGCRTESDTCGYDTFEVVSVQHNSTLTFATFQLMLNK